MLSAGIGLPAGRHEHKEAMQRLTSASAARQRTVDVGTHVHVLDRGAGRGILRLFGESPPPDDSRAIARPRGPEAAASLAVALHASERVI